MKGDTDPGFAYFRAIEEAFVRLRGAPFLLSPSDWRVASRWHEAGVPLAVVVEAMEELFERRRERGATTPVQGLRYCSSAVEELWGERRELDPSQPAEEGYALDVSGRLKALAAALGDALPEELPARAGWPGEVEALGGSGAKAPVPETVERGLAAIEERLFASLREVEDGRLWRRAEAEASEAAVAVAGRVGEKAASAARDRLVRDALRRHLGLPVLSLFAPEASNPRPTAP